MGLAHRARVWTTAVVLITGGTVAALGSWWGAPPGFTAVAALACAALWAGAMAAQTVFLAPVLASPDALARQVRQRAHGVGASPLATGEPVLGDLVDALNESARAEAGRQAALSVRLEALVATLEQSTNGVILVDDDDRILFANARLRDQFRLRGEPVGRRPLETVPAVEVHEAVQAARGGDERVAPISTATGDLEVHAASVAGGLVVAWVVDVSELRDAERSRSTFVANVSHELRTPITALMGYSETLLADRTELPAPIVPLIETLGRNAIRLRDLFEDLLKLHRIEARGRELPLARSPLAPVLAEACASSMELAGQKGSTFTLDCPEGLEAPIHREALLAIVGNLAINAVRYTPDGGHIEVRAAEHEGGVQVEVVDDGIGIPDVHMERIWDRFYRIDAARSRAVGGTGLGLAIVKHYALASRCQVSLTSVQDEGSRFVVELPLR